jgi:hypothetical protein
LGSSSSSDSGSTASSTPSAVSTGQS